MVMRAPRTAKRTIDQEGAAVPQRVERRERAGDRIAAHRMAAEHRGTFAGEDAARRPLRRQRAHQPLLRDVGIEQARHARRDGLAGLDDGQVGAMAVDRLVGLGVALQMGERGLALGFPRRQVSRVGRE
jgi:hypothetical protein